MATADSIRDTIEQYASRFSAGDTDGWVALFTEDAHQEDPVGSPANVGHEAIRAFYEVMQQLGGPQISLLREPVIVDHEAIVILQAVAGEGETRSRLPFICDHMRFADDGRIASLRAFWDGASMESYPE